jgi:cell division protein ZapB
MNTANDPIAMITERVERLLLRHEELQRTNALLLVQVQTLRAEKEALQARLLSARNRVDALLGSLPLDDVAPEPAQPPGEHARETD